MARETRSQRDQRLAAEAAAESALFQRTKHERMLNALAWAADLGVTASVTLKDRGNCHSGLRYCFDFDRIDWGTLQGEVSAMTEFDMATVERALDEVHMERERERRKETLKKQVLARLSNEEREALGL